MVEVLIRLTSIGLPSNVQETLVTGNGVPVTLHSKLAESPSVTRMLIGGRIKTGGTENINN